MGISRRQGRARRAAGGHSDPRAQGGAGHRGGRAVPGAAHLRKPRLSRVPSPDAALCMPALGGNGDRPRAREARLGQAQPAPGLSHASCRRAIDFPFDNAVVRDRAMQTDWIGLTESRMLRSKTAALVRRFLHDARGTTAIEYGLIASGIAGTIISVIWGLGADIRAN